MRSVFLTLVILMCGSLVGGASAQLKVEGGKDAVQSNHQNGNSDPPNEVPATSAKKVLTDPDQNNSKAVLQSQMHNITNDKVNAIKVIANPKEQGTEESKKEVQVVEMDKGDHEKISGGTEDKGEVTTAEGGEKVTSGADQPKVEKSDEKNLHKDAQGKADTTKDSISKQPTIDVTTLEHKPLTIESNSDAKSEDKGKPGEIGGNRPYEPPALSDEAESSHFFAYLVFTAVVVAVVYIAYHNKRKIIAYVLEGKRSRSARRPKSTEYQKLEQDL
uniref:trans-Golgi network integral membrane protein 2 n=1 Tax=Doryrhamphus excisus TaxID=161450 RepID=UPI0025AE662F|nr:trans-Golgi network integral membrane protein 2 [Doryrhamphus excisus]